jgi:hypothetical protein
MRRWTLITLIALFLAISAAAVAQIVIATRHHAPYPGPVASPVTASP